MTTMVVDELLVGKPILLLAVFREEEKRHRVRGFVEVDGCNVVAVPDGQEQLVAVPEYEGFAVFVVKHRLNVREILHDGDLLY